MEDYDTEEEYADELDDIADELDELPDPGEDPLCECEEGATDGDICTYCQDNS